MKLPIHSYNQPSRVPSRLVNCYAQQTVSSKSPVELVSAPGIVPWTTLAGPGRGMIVVAGQLYAVAGETLYRIAADGTATALGTVPGSERLTLAANDVGEIITSNGQLWNGMTVGAIGDPDVVPFGVVGCCDGYMLGTQAGTDVFVWSDLRDASSWDALDFSGTIASSDLLVSLKVDHVQVILFGSHSSEIFWLSGSTASIFERIAGGTIELGCAAALSPVKADNSVFWLANDRTFRRLQGQTPIKVSQHGVEERIASYPLVSDCVAFSFTWNGHILVVWRFPSAKACWVLDVTTGEWHERATYGDTDWQITDAVHCYDKVLLQSDDGSVGYLSDTEYTEFGGILRREWTYPQVYQANSRLFHSNLEMILRTGDAPIGTAPYIHLEISNDGGNTWTTLPRRLLGNVGEYSQRIRWRRLGTARDRVYRAYVSDAVPLRVLATELTVT